jgi:predicted porin
MNKFSVVSLVAGVGLVASTSVHAQSSVTLYGILDVGVEYANHVAQTGGSSSAVREQSGNLAGSRWGFKGNEDLGGGYKAVFTLESGFNLNNGTLGQGGRLFGCKAFVGISHPAYVLKTPERPIVRNMMETTRPALWSAVLFSERLSEHTANRW